MRLGAVYVCGDVWKFLKLEIVMVGCGNMLHLLRISVCFLNHIHNLSFPNNAVNKSINYPINISF